MALFYACAEKMMKTFVRGSFDGSFGLKIGMQCDDEISKNNALIFRLDMFWKYFSVNFWL